MNESKVETAARVAQWRIENMVSSSYRRSEPFKMGLWNWHLSVEKSRYVYVRLFPEPSRHSKEQPPIATFMLRLYNVAASRRPLTSLVDAVHDRLLRSSEDYVWAVEIAYHGRFIIDVEFLDLKVASVNGAEPSSIWPNEGIMRNQAIKGTLACLSRMLNDGLHADVTINTANGTVRAHRAILAERSTVFERMLSEDFKCKESSIVNIEDISVEACTTLLNYLYGGIKYEDFREHRIALLRASEKFDIGDLKEACEESLLEDIDSKNVLERLQVAWHYELIQLKKGCLKYLFDFGKIYDVREDLSIFFQRVDRELMIEMFQEVLNASGIA
ncbi:BTB/POZ domain-containing protein At1g21780 isoform X1 [Cryptomeria japonica]|uniref:BTB/POZ domain-containing protein At1g21780 isoform X1 n=1 Tax=Cryptomeria japonica TaxID=3369 RepID=UPI0025AC6816|nr:BTB/POZ domain-containing protein At1g21780 isoform X1 [Cryptomeria japonica]